MNEMEEQVISLSEIFEALKKRCIMIVAITLSATLISGLISFFVIDPVYETRTKVFIGKEENDETAYNTNDIQMYQKVLQNYAQAIKTRDLVGRAIDFGFFSTTNIPLPPIPYQHLELLQVLVYLILFQVVLYFYKYYLNTQVRKLILHLP